MAYYDRYREFRKDGEIPVLPFIEIERDGGDLFIVYDKGKMRFDSLSYKYYGDPNYGWLILQANPQYGGWEYSIPDSVTLRIPYPLQTALNRYERKITEVMSRKSTLKTTLNTYI